MSYVSEAFEQQQATLKSLKAAYAHPGHRTEHQVLSVGNFGEFRHVHKAERNQWLTDINALRLAQPFYWNARTTELVASTMREFDLNEIICTRHIVYCDVGWCWFGEKAPFDVQDISGQAMPVKAITWYVFGHGGNPYLGCTAWCQTDISRTTGLFTGNFWPVLWTSVNLGQPLAMQIPEEKLDFKGWTDTQTVEESTILRQFVVAACTFIRQQVFTANAEPIQRHARKRLEREGVSRIPDIRVIQLRKTAHEKKSSTEAASVEWGCQWWVGGHVRKQWYPSLGEHLPVRIHPYIKGPEGKPLKPRTTSIFSVTR